MFLLKDKEDNRMITIEEYYMIKCLKNKGMCYSANYSL